MKEESEERPKRETMPKKEASESHEIPAKSQICFQEQKKDDTQNIPLEESSEEETDSSSVDNEKVQKTVEESTEEESDSASESKNVTKKTDASEEESSEDESGVSVEESSPTAKTVEIAIHQEIPKSLKPRPISKEQIKVESEEVQDTSIVTNQPVVATAAFSSLSSVFSPMASRSEDSEKLKPCSTEENTKKEIKPQKKKQPKFYKKVLNEDAVVVPLHGSSSSDDENHRIHKVQTKTDDDATASTSKKSVELTRLHKSSHEKHPVVDEGDGLIQTLHSSSSEYARNHKMKGEQTLNEKNKISVKLPTAKFVIVPTQGSSEDEDVNTGRDDRNRTESIASEIHEIQTIQRIYGASEDGVSTHREEEMGNNEVIVTTQPTVATAAFTALFGALPPLGEGNKPDMDERNQTNPNSQEETVEKKPIKRRQRLFKKVPNQNAVYVPLHGSSDEGEAQFEEGTLEELITEQESYSEAPNEYAIYVPLNDENNESENTVHPQPPSNDQFAMSHPSLASAAFTSLFTALSPLGEKGSNKSDDAETVENEQSEESETKRPVKRKQRIFKKVPNENAVYVPLHSSSDEDDTKGNDRSVPEDLKVDELEHSQAPNEYAVYVPLFDNTSDENQCSKTGTEPISEDMYAASKPTIASVAFTSLFSAFSPLGSQSSADNNKSGETEENLQEEKNVDMKPVKRKQRIFKKVPNENAVFVPLHSSSDEENSQGEDINYSNVPRELKEVEYSEEPNEYAVFVPLQDEGYVKEEQIQKDIVADQPSVATAAFTSLFSALSPLGGHESSNIENTNKDETENEEMPKKKKQRIFRKVPNENAVYVPLHSSSEEDIALEELKQHFEGSEDSLQQDHIDQPNKYAVYVPLHGETNINNQKEESKPDLKEGDIVINNPSVATAAFSSLLSAFSPLGSGDSTNEGKLEEYVEQKENEEDEKKIVKSKQRIFKKVPNENAVFVPLHSSSDEEGPQNVEIIENIEFSEEPNKYSVYVPLSDKKDKSIENVKTEKENVLISQPSVATAAFTALYSASFSPAGENEVTSIIKGEEIVNVNDQSKEAKENENNSSNLKSTHSINVEAETLNLKTEKKRINNENNIISIEKKMEKQEETLKISQPIVATAAYTSLFTAFSPLGDKGQGEVQLEENPIEEEPITKRPTKKKQRLFKKVPNENAVFVPLHSSSDEEVKSNEEGENGDDSSIKKEMQSYSEAPNEYKILVPLHEDISDENKSNEELVNQQRDIGQISQSTIAAAAFSSLFSAFSPLGESEQSKLNSAEQISDTITTKEEELTTVKKQVRKKPRMFKKVPNENAVFVPLHGSTDDEKSLGEEEVSGEGIDSVSKEAPNEYAIFIPLEDDTKIVENRDAADNDNINKTTIATAAFTALFSAFSPLGESEQSKLNSAEQINDTIITKEEESTTVKKQVRKKPRMFKKVPNENAVFVPLHGSTDDEKSLGEEEVSGEGIDTVSKEAPNEYAIFIPLEDDTKIVENRDAADNDNINKTTIATAAFTALFSAFSPLGESEQSKLNSAEQINDTIITKEEESTTVKKQVRKKPRMFKKVPNENAVFVPLHGSTDDEKSLGEEEVSDEGIDSVSKEAPNEYAIFIPLQDDTKIVENRDAADNDNINKTTIATAAFTALFSAFSPLGESEQAKNNITNESINTINEDEIPIKKVRKKPRMFKKVPNENAVYVPLHGSSDEEKSTGEEEVNVNATDSSANNAAPNEYAIFVPLHEEENEIDSKIVEAKEPVNKTTVATAAFTALFSAFSPLGSTEQLKGKDVDEHQDKNEDKVNTQSEQIIKKRKHAFKKVPNEDAVIIPLQGSTDEEETPLESIGEGKLKEEENMDKNNTTESEIEHQLKEIENKDVPKKKVVKSILKTSKSSEKVTTSEDKLHSKNGSQSSSESREKILQIEEPLTSVDPNIKKEKQPGKKKRQTKVSETNKINPEQDGKASLEEPTKVIAKQIDAQPKPQSAVKMADIVLDVLAKKSTAEELGGISNKSQKEEDNSCDHEYEPIQAPRAASQPDVRSHSLDVQLKLEEEEERYEVVRPQEVPALQEATPNLQTEGGYEAIEDPKKEQRRCIKIPNHDAIIVPLHGSSDEEINPDRYENPALMMSEEEIESFPRQPLPFVNIPMPSDAQPAAHEGPTFQEKLRNQADRFTTKLKGISKPNIVIHKPKIKLPERPNIKMPEIPKIKLPERPKFNFPDKSKFHLPERPKFHLPDTSKFHLPDTSKFHFPDKPKFLTERPKFKMPERFTHREKKPKGPKGKKPNPSSLRRPLRDVVTISSQSTPGSTHNIFETLKFRTYPRFFKKKKAPIQKMSSLETESSQPSTPPRRPRRFSDQQQDTSWVHSYNRDIRFADEETNLRVERMEEEYEREENTAPFHEHYDGDVSNMERDFKETKAESLISVASEKGSSGSSSNRRTAGVIEEIDSDEFFLRQKGLSREDVAVSRYLSMEIRDAFRHPKNALANLDNELYDEEEPEINFEHLPRAPQRNKLQKSASADRGSKEFHTFPKRPSRRKDSDPDIVVKPPRRFRSKSGSRQYRSRQSSMPSLSADVDMGPAPEPPRRTSRERSIRSLTKEGRASDLDIVHTRISAQHSGDIPPIAPLRKSRSRGTSLADDDRTSRGADSGILPVDDEILHQHHAGREIDEEMIDDEVDIEDDIAEEPRHEPIRTQESFEIEERERSLDYSGYAVVTKDRKKPPRPPQPAHQHFDFQSQLDTIKTTGKNIFFTYPRRAIKSLHKPLPHRPMRNYNTLGPVRPPRRNRVFRKPVYMTGDAPTQETFIDKERDLQSGEVVSRMKIRPLPAPPRPPRKSRDYDVLLGEMNESSPTDTIIGVTEVEVEQEQEPEVKESRTSYLKAKKDEFLRTISKYTSFESKKDEEEEEENPKVQTTSQQTSFELGEVSVSIQTDPLPKDVIVIDQEIEETEEILILSDGNGKEEKYETDSRTKTRSPGLKERKLKEDTEDESTEDTLFQHALERVEAARGVLKEARERVIPGSTSSLDDRRTIDDSDRLFRRGPLRGSLPASPRSGGIEKEGTPPPLPARPDYTKPIPVSFPDKLHLTELDVDRLNVSEIQANKIKVSEIESTCIEVTELTSRGGNLTLNGLELPPDFISNVVAQVTSQVSSQVSSQVASQVSSQVQSQISQQVQSLQSRQPQRELTPQRQTRRVLTPPPSIVVQTSAEPVSLPELKALETEVTEHIPQPKTTKSKGRKSHARVIDDSEDELASIMPRRRDQEKDKKGKIDSSMKEDPPLPSPAILPGPSLGQASSLQLMGRLLSIWHGHAVDGAGTIVKGVNSLFPEGEKRRDAQIAAVILLIIITGLILIGFGFDNSVHHHHWDYLPPR